MKIALIGRYTKGDKQSGNLKFATDYFEFLKKVNPDTFFLTYYFKGEEGSNIFKKIFGYKKLNDRILKIGIVPLILLIIKNNYHILHIVTFERFQIIILLLKYFLKTNIITTVHNSIKFDTFINSKKIKSKDLLLEKLIVRKSDRLVFVSRLLSEKFEQIYSSKFCKHSVIHHPVPKEFTNVDYTIMISGKYKFVFYNGSDNIDRGIGFIINSLKSFSDLFELHVIGKKEKNVPEVSNNIYYYDLMDTNDLVTFAEDKHFIIKSDLFDTFSIFTAEMMSLGLIPIVSENTGIKEFIIHGENGFIYSNSVSLQVILNGIFSNKYDLNTLSTKCRLIKNELTYEKTYYKYLELYREMIE